MNIDGLDRAKILCALYNRAKVRGLGFLHAKDGDLPEDEAREMLRHQTRFEYLYGRVLKVDLGIGIGADLDTRLYDRDNGPGAAEYAILEYLTRPEARTK